MTVPRSDRISPNIRPRTDPMYLDMNAVIEEMERVAASLPVEVLLRSEALALTHLMQAIIDRVNDIDDRHPAPVLTLHRRSSRR